ncbi:MAG: hypothetical protein HY943_19375 [Gammaproteobacteria bacterium]|nr:hypothetical protein [Gammaproteobacteria bacterium]
MPDLHAELRRRAFEALALAEVGEIARIEAASGSRTRAGLHPIRLEALYEMAYLRVFVSWEAFLEQAFLRYLCGYASAHGTATPRAGTAFCSTLAQAETAVLNGNAYVLWHNPSKIIARCRRFFSVSQVESVIASNTARLDAFAAVRHRIAHAQADAKAKFDLATMTLYGRRYPGSRAGSFLRDRDISVAPPERWLDRLAQELISLSRQIA